MKRIVRSDKGFSLVELVIVILIMAILAIALAPQVMNWVNNSRISEDLQTRDSMISCAQYAVSDPAAYEETRNKQIEIKAGNGGCTIAIAAVTGADRSITAFVDAFASYAGETAVEKDGVLFIEGIKTKTAEAEVTVTVNRGVVSSTISDALISSDLGITTADVSAPSGIILAGAPGSTVTANHTGTVSASRGGGVQTSPTNEIGHKIVEEGGNIYVHNTLVVSDTTGLNNVKTDGVIPPAWVYVGGFADKDAPTSEEFKKLALYKWDGSKDGAGNPVWKLQYVNGL